MDVCNLAVATACSMEMSAACDTAVLLPIVVVPISKTEQKVQLEMDLIPLVRVEVVPTGSYIDYVPGHLILPNSPPSYNTPLLI